MTTPVVALFLAKPGSEARLEALFRAVIPPTLAEDGCLSYQLNRDLDEPRRFVWTEEWASREALERHLASPHIAELLRLAPEHVESSQILVLGAVAGGKA